MHKINLLDTLVSKSMQKRLDDVFKDLDPSELNIRVEECLRYLFLLSNYSSKDSKTKVKIGASFIPVNQQIDDIWHEFILQTKEYKKLCETLPGKFFIHHESGSFDEYSEARGGTQQTIENMLKFLPGYYLYFGTFNKERVNYWVVPNYLVSSGTMSLEELNNLLANEIKNNPSSF